MKFARGGAASLVLQGTTALGPWLLIACADSSSPSSASSGSTVDTSTTSNATVGGTTSSASVSDGAASVQTTVSTVASSSSSLGSTGNVTSGSSSSTTGEPSSGGAGGSSGNASGAGGTSSPVASGGGGAGGSSEGPPVVDLMNGSDLTGWVVATGWPNGVNRAPLDAQAAEALFPIDDDGALHVYRDAEDGSEQPRATLMTEASYANYRLWVEYRWGTKTFAPYEENPRDAGILFHITGDTSAIWPASIEFQILEGQTGDLWVLKTRCTSLALNGGGIFVDEADGGTPKAFDGSVGGYSQHQRSEQRDSLTEWNELEMTVTEDSAVYVVNGEVVNKVFDIADSGGNTVREGPIALQAEYAEVLYRNVRLQELP